MKKILAMVIAFALCFALLCACDDKTDDKKTDSTDTASTATSETDETEEDAQISDSAKELISKVHAVYKSQYDGGSREEETFIDFDWTENGATIVGYHTSTEGRSDMTMELTLDDEKIPTSIVRTVTEANGEIEKTTVTLSYPAARQIKATTTHSDPESRSSYVLYEFDEDGRVIREERETSTRYYEYDSKGNCIREYTQNSGETEISNEKTTVYTYDSDGKIIFAVDTNVSRGTENQKHYCYYPNGNVMYTVTVDSHGNANHNFSPYNTKDFTWSFGASETGGMDYTYEKDANGYISKVTCTYAGSGETKTATFEYDANGNLVKETDFNGYVNTWEYDSLGRPAKYIRHGDSEYITTYEYDSEGHLIKTESSYADGGTTNSEIRTYNDAGMTSSQTTSYSSPADGYTSYEFAEIEYVENSNCTINEEWAEFFLTHFLNMAF